MVVVALQYGARLLVAFSREREREGRDSEETAKVQRRDRKQCLGKKRRDRAETERRQSRDGQETQHASRDRTETEQKKALHGTGSTLGACVPS